MIEFLPSDLQVKVLKLLTSGGNFAITLTFEIIDGKVVFIGVK